MDSQQAPTKDVHGFVLVAPPGFEERPEEKLYYNAGLRGSIRPSYKGGADFNSIASEFTEANLKMQGMELDHQTTVNVEGRETLFVKGRRTIRIPKSARLQSSRHHAAVHS